MKPHFRIHLPELRSLDEGSLVNLVQVDGTLNEISAEQIRLQAVAGVVRSAQVYVLLDPADAVVTDIKLPPLPRARLHEAVVACVEPMILGRLDSILIAHTARNPKTGMLQVAWTDRKALLRAWRLLLELGLRVKAIMPDTQVVTVDTDMLEGATQSRASRIRSGLPDWSFTQDQEQPVGAQNMARHPVIWSLVAACVWILGLALYAMRLSHETQALEQTIEATVRTDFPEIPVLLDPVLQAERQLALLERQSGGTSPDLFVKLISDTHALLPFATARVRTLEYRDAELVLTLAHTPDANTSNASLALTNLNQEAARQGLVIVHDRSDPSRWQISRLRGPSPDQTTEKGGRP